MKKKRRGEGVHACFKRYEAGLYPSLNSTCFHQTGYLKSIDCDMISIRELIKGISSDPIRID